MNLSQRREVVKKNRKPGEEVRRPKLDKSAPVVVNLGQGLSTNFFL
jgi:hypothetical protein